MEVIAGVIILAIAFGGLLATFVGVRSYIKRANKRLIASDLASRQLGDLYRAVRDDTWTTGDLRIGSTNIGSYTIDRQVYEDAASPNNYSVTAIGNCRRVSVTVNYP
jgi:hypothetical protein